MATSTSISSFVTPPLQPGEPGYSPSASANGNGSPTSGGVLSLAPLPPQALAPVSQIDFHVAAPPSPTNRTLVVFDFDWTLIDADSDELCLTYFGGEKSAQDLAREYAKGGVWCELVANELARLFEKHDIGSLDVLRKALCTAPMHAKTIELLVRLWEAGCIVVILSDANTFFIETILEHYNVRHCVHTIITNLSTFQRTPSDRDILVVHPLQGTHDPHGCVHKCPSNLCKASMLARWRDAARGTMGLGACTTVYVGDGMNDLCPMRAGLVDVGFVRTGKKLHSKLLMHPVTEQGEAETIVVAGDGKYMRQSLVPCQVVEWDNGADLFTKVTSELGMLF
ncbi:putative phosphatase-domain-containing protein [Catenaria anguillulae PL171]|uniref:Putative phosphatase-domain-containing protein n=1 Tax=Catenaria anguillulae PL171 TaxID=765915 RepID=A0A1Y2HV09_9FUNG|nr:putative phosphatase-domain-containing protein [Catenaria anguillulae PL171]